MAFDHSWQEKGKPSSLTLQARYSGWLGYWQAGIPAATWQAGMPGLLGRQGCLRYLAGRMPALLQGALRNALAQRRSLLQETFNRGNGLGAAGIPDFGNALLLIFPQSPG